jgi:hypothetical protein
MFGGSSRLTFSTKKNCQAILTWDDSWSSRLSSSYTHG